MKKLINENKGIFIIIFLFIAISILYFTDKVWWDSAVYVGMGKYIWSFGKIGLWEPARPVMLPIMLGFIWRTNLNPVFFGSLISISLSCISIYMVYLLTKKFSDKKTSLISSFFFALNAGLIYFSSKVLTDIPSMFLSLLAFYLIISRKKFFAAGLLIGMAILTKFTHILFIPVIVAGIFFMRENFVNSVKKAASFSIGLFIMLLPFLVYNLLAYKNPLFAFIKGNELISNVVMNDYSSTSKLFYLNNIFFQNPILILSMLPIVMVLKYSKIFHQFGAGGKFFGLVLLSMALIVPFIYHSIFLNIKELRYEFIFLPYLYILAGRGYHIIKMGILRKNRFLILLTIIIVLQASHLLIQAYGGYLQSQKESNDVYAGFDIFLEDKNIKDIKGEVWSTTPMITLKKDIKINELMYYPVFDSIKIEELNAKMSNINAKMSDNIQYIFLDYCDIPCVRNDAECQTEAEQLISKISSGFRLVFEDEQEGCRLEIYEWRK